VIKINFLISYKDYAAAQGVGGVAIYDEDEKKQILIDMSKRLLIIALGPLGLYVYEMQTIPVLTQKKVEMQAKLNELNSFIESKQGIAQQIQAYQDEMARFTAQMDFINKIQADKLNEYKLFIHLKDSTPPTVWINRLELRDNSLIVVGESVDPVAITQFMERLAGTDFITNLVPVSQDTKQDYQGSGVDTTLFQIKANLNVSNQQPPAGGTQ
jgi:Tfp pilus assembly protein PilN